jgi:hypothetical protein
MIIKLKKFITCFLLITIIGFAIPSPKKANADLITGTVGLIDSIFGLICDVFGLIPGSSIIIGDTCDAMKDLGKTMKQMSLKYPQPKVDISFIEDSEGGINGEATKMMIRAMAKPEGFDMGASAEDNMYFTWSVNGDYKYNAYLAGGSVTNQWGTIVKKTDANGAYYVREGGEGYNAWKTHFTVANGDENKDNDGFSAPWGGPNGNSNKCAKMSSEEGNVIDYNSCADMGHEFTKLRVKCPDGTTGVIGDGNYTACEEFTWGTDPTQAVSSGKENLPDEEKMAGVGGENFFFYNNDVGDLSSEVTVYTEGTTYRPIKSTDAYYYIMKAQATKKAYEQNNDLSIDIIISPTSVKANDTFTATIDFIKKKPDDPKTLYYHWWFWRKGQDRDTEGVTDAKYDAQTMVYPGDNKALDEGTYYVEAQVCNQGLKLCGESKKISVLVGGESGLSLEGLVGESQFEPIGTLLHQDIIKVSAECVINPNVSDTSLGCDKTGYKYKWDVFYGPEENQRLETKAYPGEEGWPPKSAAQEPQYLDSSPSIIFEIPHDVTSVTISADGIGNTAQDTKIGKINLVVYDPTVDITVNKGGQIDAGFVGRASVYAGRSVELEAIPGPPESTFAKRGDNGRMAYYWQRRQDVGSTKKFTITADSTIGKKTIVTVYGINIDNRNQFSDTNKIVLTTIAPGKVAGVSTWNNFYSQFAGGFAVNDGLGLFWLLISFIAIIIGAYGAGQLFAKKQIMSSRISNFQKASDNFD